GSCDGMAIVSPLASGKEREVAIRGGGRSDARHLVRSVHDANAIAVPSRGRRSLACQLERSELRAEDFSFGGAADLACRVRSRIEFLAQILAARRSPSQTRHDRLERVLVTQPEALVLLVAGSLEVEGYERGRRRLFGCVRAREPSHRKYDDQDTSR